MLNSNRILIVDDDPSVHDYFHATFEATDFSLDSYYELMDMNPEQQAMPGDEEGTQPVYEIVSAFSGISGVEQIKEAVAASSPFAVVYIDMRMPPGIDGMETAKRIREIDQQIYIYIVSAYSDRSLEELQKELGYRFLYLQKPLESVTLQQTAFHATSSWHRDREIEQYQLQEKRALQQEVHRKKSELNNQKRMMDQLLEAEDFHSIISMTNLDGNITYANRQFCEISGYSKEELVGKNHRIVKSNQHAPEFYQELWQTISTGKVWQGIVCNLKKGGEEHYWVQATIVPFFNDAGEIERYISIRTDITDRMKTEAALETAIKAKDEFLATMSHELRTPLTSIIGNGEYLLEGDQCKRAHNEGESCDILRSITSAGKLQLALVNDILDMSKIESGKFSIEPYPYNLAFLLKDLKRMFESQAQDKGLTFKIEQKNHEEYLLIGDGQRIGQILINLISNALKFTEQGGVSLTTHIEGEKLYFTIKDSGIGMPPEVMERLFTRFEQADGSISRRFGGSGLGLYISMNLAELMKGNIEVSSREGKGSTFQLILPYSCSDLPERREQELEQRKSVLEKQLSGHVLVAEDTPLLQQLERRTLEKMGLEVTVAKNGREAVALAERHSFDAILMDMQMPEMDGIEATQILRAKGITIPIFALTANVMEKHRKQFTEAGCDAFVGKPIDKDELKRLLVKHLNS